MAPSRIVVMGVAGSGKSTVAEELAARRGARLLEADAFHSASNREKMASGSPLTDGDRWPWLAALRQAMRAEQQVVVACSSLKRAYRDALRGAGDVRFVHLVADRDEVVERVAKRTDHFMGVTMIESQFKALQPPEDDETDVASIDAGGETASVVDAAEAALATLPVGTAAAPLLGEGGPSRSISRDELAGSSTGSRRPRCWHAARGGCYSSRPTTPGSIRAPARSRRSRSRA